MKRLKEFGVTILLVKNDIKQFLIEKSDTFYEQKLFRGTQFDNHCFKGIKIDHNLIFSFLKVFFKN
jgi:hypothetical protein